jgi:multicomponent Na+:H+ antiporter subunit F
MDTILAFFTRLDFLLPKSNLPAFLMLLAAFLLAFGRMVKADGHNHRTIALDRVVALDLIGILSIGLMALYAVETGEALFVDVAIIVALIAFLGTVAFARYLEKGRK